MDYLLKCLRWQCAGVCGRGHTCCLQYLHTLLFLYILCLCLELFAQYVLHVDGQR